MAPAAGDRNTFYAFGARKADGSVLATLAAIAGDVVYVVGGVVGVQGSVIKDLKERAGGIWMKLLPQEMDSFGNKMDGTFDVHLGDIDSKNPLRDANISELLFGAGDKEPATAIVEIRKVSPAKTTLAVGESTSATA